MPNNLPPKKATLIADIEFVLSECARVNKLIKETPPAEFKNLPRDEIMGSLPHPSGGGDMPCSGEAARRLWVMAEHTLKRSAAKGTLQTVHVYNALKELIVQRFVREQRAIDEKQVDRLLASAVRDAERTRSDTVHFIPCRLMHAGNPDTFAIGPVSFMTTAKFMESTAPKFEAYVKSEETPARVQMLEGFVAEARSYYADFSWVAQVKVLNCDPRTSQTRADMAVTAALNFLHAFFGAYHTRRMKVGGPRLERDQRARLTLDAEGRLDISCSSSATSAVGFSDGWGVLLEGERMDILLRGAAKALEPLVDPSVQRPLGMRLVDAAAWFGDAVREPSPAAQIIKSVTGLEALVMTGEREEITALLAARAAAVAYHPALDKTFEQFEASLREAYEMRSRLTHGSLSPFDPEVEDYAPLCLQLAEEVISAGLELFESHGFMDRPRTQSELSDAFDALVSWVQAHSAARTRSGAAS